MRDDLFRRLPFFYFYLRSSNDLTRRLRTGELR
ncbi:MAG: hypothetical protein GPOALKHO_002005 [Sodalis sp.]|nr:MAG: hypothetical protein GPOALKHO_002005 [Sodalis sp.]